MAVSNLEVLQVKLSKELRRKIKIKRQKIISIGGVTTVPMIASKGQFNLSNFDVLREENKTAKGLQRIISAIVMNINLLIMSNIWIILFLCSSPINIFNHVINSILVSIIFFFYPFIYMFLRLYLNDSNKKR